MWGGLIEKGTLWSERRCWEELGARDGGIGGVGGPKKEKPGVRERCWVKKRVKERVWRGRNSKGAMQWGAEGGRGGERREREEGREGEARVAVAVMVVVAGARGKGAAEGRASRQGRLVRVGDEPKGRGRCGKTQCMAH